MKLMEYQAKALLEQFGIPTMKSVVTDTAEGLSKLIDETGLQYPVVIKAQVQIGGRGKAGGIQFAENGRQAEEIAGRLLFSELRGYRVNKLMLVEKCKVEKEWYLSIMLDRAQKCPLIIFSTCGGMEIEEIAKTHPDKVVRVSVNPMTGVQDYTIQYLMDRTGLQESTRKQLSEIISRMYRMFFEYHTMLVEINPLVINTDGNIVALDAKVDIDDSALCLLPDIQVQREELPEMALVKEARSFRFLYIPIEEDGEIGVMSNGSGMLMSCIDLISKQGLKVGAALDLGGGATAERIKEAVRIVLSTPGLHTVFICIFGGITRCDEVAEGIRLALEHSYSHISVIVRMEGTNQAAGIKIIQSIGERAVLVNSIPQGTAALADRRFAK